jgi:alkylation response protein AidB-like acyl-CoA dehydrogenase
MNVISTRRILEESDQLQLLSGIDRWLAREVKPVVKEHDHADIWPSKIVAQMQELGLFGATIGTEYGGLESSCAFPRCGWRLPASSTPT